MQVLQNTLLSIEPKGEFTKMIIAGMRAGRFEDVLSVLKDQYRDAPRELKEAIGEECFMLIAKEF
jgi:hypothetical protein